MAIVIKSNTQAFKTVGSKERFSYGISSQSAHLMKMLRKTTYTDKILAVVREYYCNARDSVLDAGKKVSESVFVTLPNALDLNFRVKDEGLGLSKEEVHTIFRLYGESTKRDSNQFIGQLGIGSKSAFAYTDSYHITAIKDGIKCVFFSSASDDLETEEGRGVFDLVSEEETDEPNGVEIVVPVRQRDCDTFMSRFLWLMSFVKSEDRPVVLSGMDDDEWQTQNYAYSGNGWGVVDGNGYMNSQSSYAIMGGVPYRISADRLGDDFPEEMVSLVKLGVHVHFNVGDLEFTTSREELEYTTHTKSKLEERLKTVISELASCFEDVFQDCDNLWTARFLYHKFYMGSNLRRSLKAHVIKDNKPPVWNGIVVDSNEFAQPEGARIQTFAGIREGFYYKALNVQEERLDRVVIERDTKPYGERQKAAAALQDHPNAIFVQFADDAARQAFFNANGIDESFINYKLSDFKSRRDPSINPKNRLKVFMYKPKGAIWKNPSSYWEPVDVDIKQDEGIYVEISRYRIHGDHPSVINQWWKCAAIAGLDVSGMEVYGLKPAVAAKASASKNWTSLQDWLRQKAELMACQNKMHLKHINISRAAGVSSFPFKYHYDTFHNLDKLIQLTQNADLISIRDKINQINKLIDTSKKYLSRLADWDDKCNFMRRFSGEYDRLLEATGDCAEIKAIGQLRADAHKATENFYNKHLLLKRLNDIFHALSTEELAAIKQYFEMIKNA